MMRGVFIVIALLFPIVLLFAALGMEVVERRLDRPRRAAPDEPGGDG